MKDSRQAAVPRFWRDEAVPFLELRSIDDGRQVGYGRHSHAFFSLGAVTAGRCTYSNREQALDIGQGTVVLMNPGDVHACNPIDGQRWSYLMLYVDKAWLGHLQQRLGLNETGRLRRFASIASNDASLYHGLLALRQSLLDPLLHSDAKCARATALFSHALACLALEGAPEPAGNPRLEQAVRLIDAQCGAPLDLATLCRAAQLSPSQLTRGFRQRYGLTPHAYLLNRRIQFAHARLKEGAPLAEVAQDAGFADQAHLQRTFKQLLAATPGQYRNPH